MAHTPGGDESLGRLVDSHLFDDAWLAAQTGERYADRAAAAADYQLRAGRDGPDAPTPHALFEPLFLYPGGRWRRSAPDPLTFYLTEPGESDRSPHPLLPLADITDGTVSSACAAAVAAALTQPPADPAIVATSAPGRVAALLPATAPLKRMGAWLRRLHHAHSGLDLEVVIVAADRPTLRALAPARVLWPSVRVVLARDAWAAALASTSAEVVVAIRPELEPPIWPWLRPLVDAVSAPGTCAAAPLLLTADFVVATAGAEWRGNRLAPRLSGLSYVDAEHLAHDPLPGVWPGIVAVRAAEARRTDADVWTADGETVLAEQLRQGTRSIRLVAESWVVTPSPIPATAASAPRPTQISEGAPSFRWVIDIAAPAAPRGRLWGDYHFARSLAAALERRGQWVVLDHPETRGRASRADDDVVLVLRGLDAVPRPPGPTPPSVGSGQPHLLWVISHPDRVTPSEVAGYDRVFAAGGRWAQRQAAAWGVSIDTLPQCTDTTRFHPGLAEPDTGPAFCFVGNSRGAARPAVAAAVELGLPLQVWGRGWDQLPTAPQDGGPWLVADSLPNDELGSLYATAGVVLNDHWADMREQGFVSNRVFDVLACGGRLVTDDVVGLDEVLGEDLGGAPLPRFRTPADLTFLTRPHWREHFAPHEARTALAHRIVDRHSFDARADTLLTAGLTVGLTAGLRARTDYL